MPKGLLYHVHGYELGTTEPYCYGVYNSEREAREKAPDRVEYLASVMKKDFVVYEILSEPETVR